MPIQIGQKPSPTFEQPLELLSDCHRRVEMFLRALLLVCEQARGGELNPQQREALETALRYFREAAPKHTADEEESLFPRMRQSTDPAVRHALARIDALEADHQSAKADHDTVDALGRQWLKNNALSPQELTTMSAALEKLRTMYERHIAMEDNEVFPLASRTVPPEQLAEVGREMAQRRRTSA
jgi:hemerythrin-like domain-containing protein